MNKLVQEAPYHPGYEDAVIEPAFAYKGVDPAKLIWKAKPLSDKEIIEISSKCDLNHVLGLIDFARAIEQRHGIK